jgi:pyridoxal 5'-phosphate synthase pdxS subunit
MVKTMIYNVIEMNESQLKDLAEDYSQSYLKSAEILQNKKVGEDTIVFENYKYSRVKNEIFEILYDIKNKYKRMPIVNFAAGGVATPADAAIMMQLGSDGVFVGSGIFKSNNPEKRAKAIVQAVTNFDKADIIAKVSKDLGDAMPGLEIENIPKEQLLQERGW